MTIEQLISDVIPDFNTIPFQESHYVQLSSNTHKDIPHNGAKLNDSTVCLPHYFDVKHDVAKETQKE